MPGKLRVRIIAARNLPIMDRSSESCDAFVEVRFGNNYHEKTGVEKRTLDPEWNHMFVFEVEEDEIQEEPLQIRVLDHDTYSSHDAIGKVYIDLKPLLNPNCGQSSLNGWFPIYDTMHGIRGEIRIQAKVEIFNDFNEYRKSSSEVQFFCSSKVPEGYVLQNYCSFVQELLINDDPEYQWMDKIRTPRTSNETRQKLFLKLSGELQRRIGLIARDMGANCVLGYVQMFDLEGERGIVVRGYGTAAIIHKSSYTQNNPSTSPIQIGEGQNTSKSKLIPIATRLSPNRCHSESDLAELLNIQPGTESGAQPQTANVNSHLRPPLLHQATFNANDGMKQQLFLDKLDYPFLTVQEFPPGFVKTLCGVVCARSVKLLSSGSIEDEMEEREKWWIEIRNEIRSHMKSLSCHAVIGYTETKSIYEDVCVLSATGTAAKVDEEFFNHANTPMPVEANVNLNCKLCHVPYNEHELPFPVGLSTCAVCGQGSVPEIIFTTVQPLSEIETIGQGCVLRAIVTRSRKKCTGETCAKIISDYLPFMEYELHRQLLGKLKLKAMNLLYGLKVQISIGENLLIGLAEATACYAAALPQPQIPKITSEKVDKSDREMIELDRLDRLFAGEMCKNINFFNLDMSHLHASRMPANCSKHTGQLSFGSNECDTSVIENQKNLFKIEIDDIKDKDELYALLDPVMTLKKGVYACNTNVMPGIAKYTQNLQMFMSVYRCETSLIQMTPTKFNEINDEIIKHLQYKFRHIPHYCLSNLSIDVSLFDDDHAMIILTGCVLKFAQSELHTSSSDQAMPTTDSTTTMNTAASVAQSRVRNSSSTENKTYVEITNSTYVPRCQIEAYVGHVNLFFIRESTQIKDSGGLSGFMHSFLSEVLAMARANVLSLGGNALVSFRLNECILLDNPHKNQAQCLINVSGDAVRVGPSFNSL